MNDVWILWMAHGCVVICVGCSIHALFHTIVGQVFGVEVCRAIVGCADAWNEVSCDSAGSLF